MINIIQIIALIVAIFAISRAFLRLKEHKISKTGFILWLFVWIGVVVIVLIPEIADKLSYSFGFKRGADILIFLALIIVFYSIFRIYIKLNTIKAEITKIVRELSIKKKK